MDFIQLTQQFKDKLSNCCNVNDVNHLKSEFLGKKSEICSLFSTLKDLPNDQRKDLGQQLGKVRNEFEALIKSRVQQIKLSNIENHSSLKPIDVTLPCYTQNGSFHPITQTRKRIEHIFTKHLGFAVVDGPEIEDDYHNFGALNFPKDHPARTMQDTFYINDDHVLRTHTSPVQVRVMQNNKPPLRVITPGRVYRCDDDPTHSPMFHQVEGLVIDQKSNFTDLKKTLKIFFSKFFNREVETKFRPSFFPFTEPSAEVDIKFNDKWLEVMGCGMVHPNVLIESNIDPEVYQGYAFGIGIDRMAMLRYGVNDLRLFFDNDIEFIQQFNHFEASSDH